MAVVVIGGQTRNLGKTGVLCGLISAMPEKCWTAIKITSHAHRTAQPAGLSETPGSAPPSVSIFQEHDPTTNADTSRYLAAGASRSLLIQAPEGRLAEAMPRILQEIEASPQILIESSSILDYLQPDLYAVVLDPENSDCKSSVRRHLCRADAILTRGEWSASYLKYYGINEFKSFPTFRIDPKACFSAAFSSFVAEKLHNSGK